MSITLVRHTRPAIGNGICYGRTDLDLDASFATDADRVIHALAPADVLITSPLLRCRRLAERIGDSLQLTPRVDARVREMDFGAWEQRAWSDIPRHELDAWAQDFLYARPHGGENVYELRERTLAALADYRQSGLTHIVVTHSGVVRSALATGDDADSFNTELDFGGIIKL